jgi:hypothetical protein
MPKPTRTHHAVYAETLAIGLCAPELFARGGGATLSSDLVVPLLEGRLQRYGDGRSAQDAYDWIWRNEGDPISVLADHAQRLLNRGGPWAVLHPDHEEPGREILQWRWVSLCTPPLLLNALTHHGLQPPSEVRVLDDTLAPLSKAAVLHLHLGAAHSFEDVWAALARRAAQDTHRLTPLRGPSLIKELTNEDTPSLRWTAAQWQSFLVAALHFRIVFSRHRQARHPGPLRDCAACHGVHDFTNIPWLDALAAGRLPLELPSLRLFPRQVPGEIEERAIHRDILEAYFEAEATDRALILQYLRVRSILYRLIVADPTKEGLAAFSKRYDLMSIYSEPVWGTPSAPSPARPSTGGAGLTTFVFEQRTTPDYWSEHAANRAPLCLPEEDGRYDVLHFLRRPHHPSTGPRHAESFRRRLVVADRVEQLLRHRPQLLRSLRGLDVASVELHEPLWLFLPILRRLRAFSRRLAAENPPLEPLRLTLHVGEDFRHVATGLRAVHEPLAWKLLERGDRLGHALALGLDLQRWAQRHPVVLMPGWERLLDLVWMKAAVAAFRLDVGASLMERIKNEAQELANVLRPNAGDCTWRLFEQLGHRELLTGFPIWMDDRLSPLAHAYLHHHHTEITAVRKVPVHDDELQVLIQIQHHLKHLLRRWQIPIEVNPSSNLLIAGLEHPLDQPQFGLAPLKLGEDALPVVISTDDPAVFSTNLADEFAYAWAGMVEGGLAPSRARAWLEEAARTSLRATFLDQVSLRAMMNAQYGARE